MCYIHKRKVNSALSVAKLLENHFGAQVKFFNFLPIRGFRTELDEEGMFCIKHWQMT